MRPYGEAKLVRCTQGSIYDVLVDLRLWGPEAEVGPKVVSKPIYSELSWGKAKCGNWSGRTGNRCAALVRIAIPGEAFPDERMKDFSYIASRRDRGTMARSS
jgi:hypothetical protein